MSSDDRDDQDGSDSGIEIPEAPKAGSLDPDELEPDEPAIADAERAAADLGPGIPTPPEPGGGDTPAVALFWKLVVVFNVAVFGITIGPMIGVFLDDWNLGLQVFSVGALAGAYGFARYYRFRNRRDDATDESGESEFE